MYKILDILDHTSGFYFKYLTPNSPSSTSLNVRILPKKSKSCCYTTYASLTDFNQTREGSEASCLLLISCISLNTNWIPLDTIGYHWTLIGHQLGTNWTPIGH